MIARHKKLRHDLIVDSHLRSCCAAEKSFRDCLRSAIIKATLFRRLYSGVIASKRDLKKLLHAIDDDLSGTIDCWELVNYIDTIMADEFTYVVTL